MWNIVTFKKQKKVQNHLWNSPLARYCYEVSRRSKIHFWHKLDNSWFYNFIKPILNVLERRMCLLGSKLAQIHCWINHAKRHILIQGTSYWSMESKSTLRGRGIKLFYWELFHDSTDFFSKAQCKAELENLLRSAYVTFLKTSWWN